MARIWSILFAVALTLNVSAQSTNEWRAHILSAFDRVHSFETSFTLTFRQEGTGDTTATRMSLTMAKSPNALRLTSRNQITHIANGYSIVVSHMDEEIIVMTDPTGLDKISTLMAQFKSCHMSDVGQTHNGAGDLIKYFKLTPPTDTKADYRYMVVAINTRNCMPLSIETWHVNNLYEHVQIRSLETNPDGLTDASIAFDRSDYPASYEFIAPSSYEAN